MVGLSSLGVGGGKSPFGSLETLFTSTRDTPFYAALKYNEYNGHSFYSSLPISKPVLKFQGTILLGVKVIATTTDTP